MGDAADLALDQMFDYPEDLFQIKADYYSGNPNRRHKVYGPGKCPDCGGETVLRISKTNKKFYGCAAFPKCRGTREYSPVDQTLTVKTTIVKKAKISVSEDGIHCGKWCGERGYMEGPMGSTDNPGCNFFECDLETDRIDWIRCPKCLKAKPIKDKEDVTPKNL